MFADPHNFGKQVSREEGASGSFFRKPRPLFWEWLFFGAQSPLKTALRDCGHLSAPKIVSALFNLEIELNADGHGGLSREIVAVPGAGVPPTSDELFSFGALISYCYIFGILDLHQYNVIRTSTHLQVVDAEVVLCDILLPNQTLLLPYKETTFQRSAIRHYFDSQDSITPQNIKSILQGFTECVELIESARAQISKVFSDLAPKMSAPIRHIMRNTALYQKHPEVIPETPFCSAELEQLDRGDIPYFFKLLGNEKLMYYTSPGGDTSMAVAPPKFYDTIVKAAVDPISLIDTARLKKHIFPTGVLFIANKFLPAVYVGEVPLSESSTLTVTKDQLTVKAPHGQFQSERSPN